MKEKLKILYVHHAGGFGGAPKSMSYIIKSLDREKYSPILINISEGPINDFFSTLPVKLMLVKGIRPFHGSTVVEKSIKLFIRNWIFLLPSILKANKIIKNQNIDLIHLNSTCLFAFAIAAKWNGVKVICHVREPLREGFWGNPLRYFCKKYIEGFIAICHYDLSSLKIPNSSRIKKEVIYNFVEPATINLLNKSFRSELGIKDDEVLFLYLARFSKSNGWIDLVKMAEEIVNQKPNYHFVLVGASNANQTNFTNSKNIHILPFRQDVSSILESTDVFVCPFTEPHFARGVIEASAFGIPVIGSNIGGVEELVIHNKTGFLYSDKDEFIEFAYILGEDKGLRKNMGANGILLVKDKFEMCKNLEQTFHFYNEFIKVNQQDVS